MEDKTIMFYFDKLLCWKFVILNVTLAVDFEFEKENQTRLAFDRDEP